MKMGYYFVDLQFSMTKLKLESGSLVHLSPRKGNKLLSGRLLGSRHNSGSVFENRSNLSFSKSDI